MGKPRRDCDMRAIVAILMTGVLLSCAVGPDYQRPADQPADKFRMAEPTADTTSIANIPWWELLKDIELQNLIRIALEENKDLRRAIATIEEYEARLFV